MKILFLCYSLVVSIAIADLTNQKKDRDRWEILQRAIESGGIRAAFDLFRSKGIEPILVKGWAAGRFYPTDVFRSTSDIDLAVATDDFDAAFALCRASKMQGLPLDLHRELRHFDTLSWQNLVANSHLVDLDGSEIRVLRPEDHLRVLAVHWLTDGGWFRDRLWDIYYAIDNRPIDFDWDRCLSSVSPVRRRWIICVIGLTHKYLDLNVDDLPFANEAKDLPHWLIRAVEREWGSGIRLLPLYRHTNDLSGFLKQVKKRLPPNPIHATVDMEGSFDASTRIHYQIGTIAKRIGPSIKKLFISKLAKKKQNG